jgi:hypothetical protein
MLGLRDRTPLKLRVRAQDAITISPTFGSTTLPRSPIERRLHRGVGVSVKVQCDRGRRSKARAIDRRDRFVLSPIYEK